MNSGLPKVWTKLILLLCDVIVSHSLFAVVKMTSGSQRANLSDLCGYMSRNGKHCQQFHVSPDDEDGYYYVINNYGHKVSFKNFTVTHCKAKWWFTSRQTDRPVSLRGLDFLTSCEELIVTPLRGPALTKRWPTAFPSSPVKRLSSSQSALTSSNWDTGETQRESTREALLVTKCLRNAKDVTRQL